MMNHRMPLLIFLTLQLISPAPARPAEEQTPVAPVIESPAPASSVNGQYQPTQSADDDRDPVVRLGELRGAVRTFPDNADSRLNLAGGLYRVGDFDAAIEECRVAIRLNPNNPRAHVQLGISLAAKQDWRAAAQTYAFWVTKSPRSGG